MGICLTNLVSIGFAPVGEGEALSIARRWRVYNFLFLALKEPDGEKAHEFSLQCFFSHAGSNYLVLAYPPDLTADDDIVPRIVVRLVDKNTLMTISEAELQDASDACLRAVQESERPTPESVAEIMGWFPVLEEEHAEAAASVGPNRIFTTSMHLYEKIHDGAFSWVYRGGSGSGEKSAAIYKIAKPRGCLPQKERAEGRQSRALYIGTGHTGQFDPDPAEILMREAVKLKSADDPGLVRVKEIVWDESVCWYSMEPLTGPTLREALVNEKVTLDVMIQTAYVMDRLAWNPGFRYHGDLKPENIVIADNGIKLIDPGLFESGGSIPHQGMITTPAYYPLLAPDDIFAFGIMLWEVATGYHPLLPSKAEIFGEEPVETGEGLDRWVRRFEGVGQHFLSPLRQLPRPSRLRPSLRLTIENILLRVLGLELADGRVDKISGETSAYESFAEIARELEQFRTLEAFPQSLLRG